MADMCRSSWIGGSAEMVDDTLTKVIITPRQTTRRANHRRRASVVGAGWGDAPVLGWLVETIVRTVAPLAMQTPSQMDVVAMTQPAGRAGPDTDAVITLIGRFADRDAWQAEGWCRIEHALELIGTRSAMILMREIYYGG